MPTFWHTIEDKTKHQKQLEELVFGCEDIWRHIKTFIFSEKKCWATKKACKGPCQGRVYISYAEKHPFRHFRQGSIRNGMYTTRMYTCRKHAADDPDNPCTIC